MIRAFAIMLAALVAACSAAPETPSPQPPDFPFYEEAGGRVRDGAAILSPETEAELTAMLEQAETIYGQQMAVVTVDSLHGYSVEEFALQYASAWGLGDDARNDGLMLLVAPNERSVRIEVAIGLEDTFTDAYCRELLDNHVLPAFSTGDYEGGIREAADELVARMGQFPSLPANDNDNEETVLEDAA